MLQVPQLLQILQVPRLLQLLQLLLVYEIRLFWLIRESMGYSKGTLIGGVAAAAIGGLLGGGLISVLCLDTLTCIPLPFLR